MFLQTFAQNLAKFLLSKNLAEYWDLPNTGIFYSKDVASVLSTADVLNDRDLHIKFTKLCFNRLARLEALEDDAVEPF
jgi:hypothetical protein